MNNETIGEVKASVDLSDLQLFDKNELTVSPTTNSSSVLDNYLLNNTTMSGTWGTSSVIDTNSINWIPVNNHQTFTYNNPNTNISIQNATVAIPNVYTNTNHNTISVQGNADINGSLTVKGVDIGDMLSKIQDQLAIYKPAPELEEKWEELRDIARKYKELVAEIKEKEAMWAILKK